MVSLLSEIANRHSGRAYSGRPVSIEDLESILEAGRWAPSCNNTQAWNFVVLTDSDVLSKARDALTRGNAYGKKAPVIVIVCAKVDAGCPSHGLPYFMMDVGLAVENMLLQAVHLGLMGHPTAGWNEELLKQVTGIPSEYRIVTVMFLGYAEDLNNLDPETRAKESQRSTRRPLSEVVHRNKW